jgi:hypothetical protein
MDIWIGGLPMTVGLAAVVVIAYLARRGNSIANGKEPVEDTSK